jgi:PAS domain S-box-containing protein
MADITAEFELSTLLNKIVERAAVLLNATGGELGIYDEETGEIEIVVSYNLGEDYIGTRHADGEGAMGLVAKTGEPLILDDYQTWEGSLSQYGQIHATLVVPLKVGGRLVGIFSTVSTDPERHFSSDDLHLIHAFAQQAAITIQNARLYDQAQSEIQERERYEREILRQKEYFEALFVNSPVAVITADLEGTIVSWNPIAERLFGYSADEAIGNHLDDIVAKDPSIHEEALGYTEQVLNVGRVQATVRRTRKDNSFVDVELLSLPVIVAGRRVGFIAIYHDITELKKIERELRQQKEYYEALFLNNPVAVVTTDLGGNVISWNPTAVQMFGYIEEEALGKNLDDLVANDPSIKKEAMDYSSDLLIKDGVRAFTERARKDGSMIDVEIKALPVIVGEEKVGNIVIYIDITELQEARRQAEAANQAKSIFLANMSHELRTPLNAILGFTQLMDRDENLTFQQRDNLGIINRSGEHLLALINDVLEMSKIEAGRIKLHETNFDLHNLLESLEEIFIFRAREKGLELSFQFSEDLPRYVRTDEGKLRQIFVNLLENAIKFTDEGRITLRTALSSHQDLENDERIRFHFEIEDTGIGIASDDLERLFEPFVQATSQTTQEGTGLGLSICRQYVEMMGGELRLTSEVGQGSLVKFDVKVGLAEESEVQDFQSIRQVKGLEPGQPTYRVLVVEDRESNRRLLANMLEPLGFEVRQASNGVEAVQMWGEFEPHLILMDILLPLMDGLEATKRIKASPKAKDTAIIALTASAFEEDRERVLSGGCDDFVRKPFHPHEIYSILAKHLGVRFIYEQDQPQPVGVQPIDEISISIDALSQVALEELSEDWFAKLKKATVEADLIEVLNLIDKVRTHNPDLADTLADLANRFQYKKLLSIIDEAEG